MTKTRSIDCAMRYDRTGASALGKTGVAASFFVSISIDTWAIAAAAYGADRLRGAVEALHRSAMAEADNILGLAVTDLRWTGAHRLALFVVAPYEWPDDEGSRIFRSTLALESRVLQWILNRFSLPVEVDGERFMLGVSASINLATIADVQKFDTAAVETVTDESDPVRFPARSAGFLARGVQSVSDYRSAMDLAVRLYDMLDAGILTLSWQKIAASHNPELILYAEGLLRSLTDESVITDPSGASRNPSAFRPGPSALAAEQAGVVRRLDSWVVSRVIERLRENPHLHLGCNISAHSVIMDAWWSEIVDQLTLEPSIARRLVLEITESASFPSLPMAVDFCHQMKALECRIAIDDFGTGRATVSDIVALNPDMVKIDGSFLRWAAAGGAQSPAKEELRHLVSFAQCRGRTVIMEGVENAETRDVAVRLGGQWLQGFDVAMPRLSAAMVTGRRVRRGNLG